MNNRQTQIKSINIIEESDDQQQIFIKNLQTGQAENSKDIIRHHESLLILKDNKKTVWSGYFSSIQKIKDKLLSLVIKRNHEQLLEILTQYPVELSEIKFMDGWSLLHFSVSQNDCITALALLKFGINVDIQSSEMQRTALHQACISNKEDMVRLLVQWNVDTNILDVERNTALHFAVDHGYTEIVKIILKSKIEADIHIRNQMNMTTFNSCRNPEIFELLIEYDSKKKKSSIHSGQTKTSSKSDKKDSSHHNYESRMIIRNSEIVPHYSRSDMVEKFLSLRETQVQSTNHNRKIEADSIISQNSLQDKNSFYLQDYAPKKNKKNKKIGSYLHNSKILKSARKAEQNIGLIRQSIFKTFLQGEQKIQNFDFLKLLGEGSFAEVFLVRKKRSNSLYGLKKISKNHVIQRKLYKYFLAEKEILTTIHHPFVLKGHFCLQNFTHLFIIMEFCPNGDLQKLVRRQKKLQEDIAGVYSCEIALALQQVHDHGYLYRDLKISNILIDREGHLKLADFGLAKQAEMSSSFLGSLTYLAPEMLVEGQLKPHGRSLDWYLFGLCIYEMLHGFPPFYSDIQQQMQHNIKHQLPKFDPHISPQAKNLILKLLQKDPLKRISSLKELKKCAWYQKINWQLILNKQYDILQFQKIDDKELRKKEYNKEPEENMINEKIQWYDDWNYPKVKH